MEYSPKLKRTAEQIKKILKDNDVAGYFVIHTCSQDGAGFSEFVVELTPSYSAVEWNKTRDSINIKGKLEHYNGDKKKRDSKLVATTNMLHHLSTRAMEDGLMLARISQKADQVWDAEHKGGGGLSTHIEQNN